MDSANRHVAASIKWRVRRRKPGTSRITAPIVRLAGRPRGMHYADSITGDLQHKSKECHLGAVKERLSGNNGFAGRTRRRLGCVSMLFLAGSKYSPVFILAGS